MDWSIRVVTDWQHAQSKNDRVKNKEGTVIEKNVKWKPPREGYLKINVDSSISKETDSFAIGMVIRDKRGMFVEGKVVRLQHMELVLDAEMRGVLEALRWAATKGLQNVCVETDSLLTVQALQSLTTSVLEVGHVLQDCLSYLQKYPSFSVVFVHRQANKVAHEMAKYPCLVGCLQLFTSPPDMLLETIMFDALI